MSDSVARRILPVIIGIGLTIILLVVLGNIAQQRRQQQAAAAPVLRVLQPRPGVSVDSPLVIQFTTTAPLALHPTGWGAGNLHLHALVNGVEYMPAAAEITRRDSLYHWTLPAVARGRLELFLGWADQRHRALQAGASDTVTAMLR
jgi:hypothetical protein